MYLLAMILSVSTLPLGKKLPASHAEVYLILAMFSLLNIFDPVMRPQPLSIALL